jgi:nucleoside-diphosphate-sugar epimerase
MISADSRTPSAYHQAYVQGVENTINALHEHNNKPHLVFISSTSLFAENLGATVTEESPIDTSSFSTKLIHEGEQLVSQSGFDYTVVRFSGIYGPQRCRLVDMVKSGTAKLKIKPYVSNRIHLDDCAGILEHLTRIDKPSQLYIASDCEPTPYNEVLEWIAKTSKAPSLKRETESSPQKHMSNKFCSNKKILATKYEFKHPNYRSGFLSCL